MKIERRDFLKLLALGAGALMLTADQRVARAINAGEIKTRDIRLLERSFGESRLSGDVVKMEESLPNWRPLINRASAALLESKYADWITTNRYGIWGRALVDSRKNIEPVIFTCILDAKSAALAPIPEKRQWPFLKNPPRIFFFRI